MKKIIRKVLDELGDTQINLGSEAAREIIAALISAALKEKGEYKKHTSDELDEQNARVSWVCSICGENTYDVDYEYIGSCTNHLGCELEADKREKNWLQKNDDDLIIGIANEEKVGVRPFNQAVFGDSKDLTEAKIERGEDRRNGDKREKK
tara:strand:+ start:2037 stop:2489 length:453 start_codon:yes stop_codon:yes gene_type:complete